MKKNNQVSKPAKPKGSRKTKLLMALMILQAVFASAKEAIVLRTISSPTESRVMLDTIKDGKSDGQADMYISIPRNVAPKALYENMSGLFGRGTRVEIDDDYILHDGNMDFSYLGGVLSIGGMNPIDITKVGWLFEAARE